MKTKLLTLAIPAYNMERYLKRCLDSVLIPEVESEIEVLLINDGSSDSTLEIANKIANNHLALKVIDKPNGGWGSAVNLAINMASGQYFKILDSDDWFNSEAFIDFVLQLRDTDADLVATEYSKRYDDNTTERFFFDEQLYELTLLSDILEKNNFRSPFPMATICYRTEIIRNLRLADRFYADVEYALVPLVQVKEVKVLNIDLYQYFLSRVDHSTSILGYQRHFPDYIAMMEKIVAFYESVVIKSSKTMRKVLQNEIIPHVCFSYYLLLSPTFNGSKKDYEEHLNQLESDLKSISNWFYNQANKAKKRGIPYIWIWRKTGINLLNIRKWI